MIVVDLLVGVFYQKCYDPECQVSGYRSEERPLPPGLCPAITLPARLAETNHSKGTDANTLEEKEDEDNKKVNGQWKEKQNDTKTSSEAKSLQFYGDLTKMSTRYRSPGALISKRIQNAEKEGLFISDEELLAVLLPD